MFSKLIRRDAVREVSPAAMDLLTLFDEFGMHSSAGEEEMRLRRENEARIAGKIKKKKKRPIHCRVQIIK
jgi:hypothetical protein